MHTEPVISLSAGVSSSLIVTVPEQAIPLDGSVHIKLCDFGNAVTFPLSNQDSSDEVFAQPACITTRNYRAPEVLSARRWGCEVDVWAAACVLFELATGAPLFEKYVSWNCAN